MSGGGWIPTKRDDACLFSLAPAKIVPASSVQLDWSSQGPVLFRFLDTGAANPGGIGDVLLEVDRERLDLSGHEVVV